MTIWMMLCGVHDGFDMGVDRDKLNSSCQSGCRRKRTFPYTKWKKCVHNNDAPALN